MHGVQEYRFFVIRNPRQKYLADPGHVILLFPDPGTSGNTGTADRTWVSRLHS